MNVHAQPDRQGEPGRSGGMENSVLLIDEHSSGTGDLNTSSMTRRAGDSGLLQAPFRLLQTRPERPIPGIGPRPSDPDHNGRGRGGHVGTCNHRAQGCEWRPRTADRSLI